MSSPNICVIDPGQRVPEVDTFNNLQELTSSALSYHLPVLGGMGSLETWSRNRTIDGIIVLGSGASVHDELGWQLDLTNWLRPHLDSGVPILGICYGHQLIAHMLGGEVGFLHQEQSKEIGFREIRFSDDAPDGLSGKKGKVVVSHREVVSSVPEGTTILASSELVSIEGLIHKTLPIWTLQPHPEATAEFLVNQSIPPATSSDDFSFGHSICQTFLRYVANRS